MSRGEEKANRKKERLERKREALRVLIETPKCPAGRNIPEWITHLTREEKMATERAVNFAIAQARRELGIT